MNITLNLNNQPQKLKINPGQRLIDWLRVEVNLTGTKEGCGEGECGACTVLLNEKPVNSCLVLMGQLNNDSIITIEGIRQTEYGQKLIDSFIKHGAVQCGFCTPGMIVMAYSLIQKKQPVTIEKIKEQISGNLCRCTGYKKIISAIYEIIEEIHE